MITDKDVLYVANLAKIDVPPETLPGLREDLSNIIAFADQIGALDTASVEPTYSLFPFENVLREDVVTNTPDRERLLANAPAERGGGFVVPRVV